MPTGGDRHDRDPSAVRDTERYRDAGGVSRRSLDAAAVLIVVGVYVLVLSLLADWLAIGSASGFGWQQWTGLLLGTMLVISGALTRVAAILVIGLLICALTLLADWLALGDTPEFGWQQFTGCVLGVALIVVGCMVGRRRLNT